MKEEFLELDRIVQKVADEKLQEEITHAMMNLLLSIAKDELQDHFNVIRQQEEEKASKDG